jgi:hypothetical protein
VTEPSPDGSSPIKSLNEAIFDSMTPESPYETDMYDLNQHLKVQQSNYLAIKQREHQTLSSISEDNEP